MEEKRTTYTEDSVIIGASSEKIPFSVSEINELLEKAVVSDDVDKIRVDAPEDEEKDDRTLYLTTEEE